MAASSKLLNYSLSTTLVANILAAAAPLIATFVDGILTGNLIGTSAFNAINIIIPISNLVMVLTLIYNMGGSVLAAKAIGNGDIELGRRIFTISSLSACVLALRSTILPDNR